MLHFVCESRVRGRVLIKQASIDALFDGDSDDPSQSSKGQEDAPAQTLPLHDEPDPQTDAENVVPQYDAQRKSNPLKDQLHKDAIEKVLRKARQEWPDARNRPQVRNMARVLHKKYGDELSFGFESIRHILEGTYSVSDRLKIPGL